jgi:dihydroorotate dehydrogenase (fumarate)
MDLSTQYLGLDLKHPVVPSASPLSHTLDGIKRMEDAGAAAVVMYSLFEEQIESESHQIDHYLNYGTESYAEALSYLPDMDAYNVGPEEYLKLVARAREAVGIPIIASLNGASPGGWTEYATQIQQAGAHALELNIYYIATDPEMPGTAVEQRYIDVLTEVRKAVTIPVAVKIGPYFSSMANMAKRLSEAGARGLVLFNRFYQPDIDLVNLTVVPHLLLSSSYEMRLPLRWTALLYGRVEADLAITSGVHDHEDVLRCVMAGANVVQMASELLRHGLGRIEQILEGMRNWMTEFEYESISQMRGSMSQRNVAEPAAYERANYMKVLDSWRQDPTGMAL